MAEQPKSRLDREIDEILEKKSKEPIKFQSHSRVQKQRKPTSPSAVREQAPGAWDMMKRMPIAMAYLFVFAAMLADGFSPLLALLLCTAAVASLWVPGILRLTRPAPDTGSDVKYWRGQPYQLQFKSAVSRSPIDSLKRYFDRNR